MRGSLLCSRLTLAASGAAMGRAIAAHRHLIDLLATGTRADFLTATSEHLTLAHQLTASVR